MTEKNYKIWDNVLFFLPFLLSKFKIADLKVLTLKPSALMPTYFYIGLFFLILR